jgi:hypothetical protein
LETTLRWWTRTLLLHMALIVFIGEHGCLT